MLKNKNLNWHQSFSKKLKIQKKSQKTLFLRWLIFDIFLQSVFCICILYLYFCIFVFLSFRIFVFLSFFNFGLLLICLKHGAVNLRQPRCVRPSQSIQIVIIIIKLVIIINRGQKITFPETCSKQCQFFCSAKHNYVSMCITVKKNFEKVEK